MPQKSPRAPPVRVRLMDRIPAAVRAAATVSPFRPSISRPSKTNVRRSEARGAKLARISGALAATGQERHQFAISPADPVVPIFEPQGGTTFGDHRVDRLLRPIPMLAALGAHSDIGRKHAAGMGGDAAAGIEVQRLEGADD